MSVRARFPGPLALTGITLLVTVSLLPASHPIQPATINATSPMITVPPSNSTPAAPWPRAGVPDYLLVLRSHGGRPAGQGVEEFDWTLQVDARAALVTVESFRSDGDLPGHPLGVFRFSLDDGALRRIHQLATRAEIHRILPEMKDHPAYTETRYVLREAGTVKADQTINNGDHESMKPLSALNAETTKLLAKALQHPERALRWSLQHRKDLGEDQWEITISNDGMEPVCLDDPRGIGPGGDLHMAAVMVTEFPATDPGGAPPWLDWQAIPLKQPAGNQQLPLITIQHGQSHKILVPWNRRKPGMQYLAYALHANYRGEPLHNGVYRVRGRTQSNRVTVSP